MPDDLREALQRFELFLESHGTDQVIDAASGFTTNDAYLLLGELEMTRSMVGGDNEPDEPLEGPVGLS
jgi:hypothetical protein